jgi:hypothetical protein
MRTRLALAITSKAGLGALLLFAAAVVTFSQVARLRMGTPSAMGPGYFPAILGGLFVLFGAILLVEGWRKPGDRVEFGPMRPVAFILGAIVLFGLLYRPLGGALAVAVLVVVAALAERRRTGRELTALVLAVLAMIWVVFVLALDLQLAMLPNWVTL